MRYEVVIETRESPTLHGEHAPLFEASVAEGPDWLRGGWGMGDTGDDAFHDAAEAIRAGYPRHTFDFIHAGAVA